MSQSSSAVRRPTARATDSVPGRRPACWKPPKSCGCRSDVVAHEERADAERAAEFVGGDGHGGGAQVAKVERQFSGCLGGIGVKRDAVLVAEGGQFGDGLQRRRFRCWRASRRRGGSLDAAVAASRSRGSRRCASTPRRSTWQPVCDKWSASDGDAGVFDGGDDEVRLVGTPRGR